MIKSKELLSLKLGKVLRIPAKASNQINKLGLPRQLVGLNSSDSVRLQK
jgi:hypothetical protein